MAETVTGQILAWGKCEVKVEAIANSGAPSDFPAEGLVLPTPVDDSTQLSPSQGDKVEAKVEGGDIVATRTDAANYALVTRIRLHSGQKKAPFGNGDGQIPGEYKVTITPLENTAAPKLVLNRCSASSMYNYTSADGIDVQYDFDVLKPTTADTPKISVE